MYVAVRQIDRLEGEVERLRAQSEAARMMLAALEGVVRVADRKTVEFDAARAAITQAKAAGLATEA